MLAIYRPYRYPVLRTSFLHDLWSSDPFSELWSGWGESAVQDPKVEMTENKKNYLIQAEFPGFDKDDIKAELEDGVLTLRAENRDEKWNQNEEEGWRSIATRRGTYQRSFLLPEDVDAEKIKATMKKGVLRLTLPRNPEKTPRHKEIQIH